MAQRCCIYSILSCLLLSLAACVSDLGISTSKSMKPPGYFKSSKSIPNQGGCWPGNDWATFFQDKQLLMLLDEAVCNNPSIEAARARIKQARSLSEDKASLLFPSLNWRGEADGGRLSGTIFPPALGGGRWFTFGLFIYRLQYNLDLWGKNLAALKQALDLEKVEEVTAQEVKLSITSAVASTYNQLAYQYALEDVLRRTVQQRMQLSNVFQARLRTGLDPKVPIYQANNQTESARRALREVEGQIKVTRQQLGTLLGKGPDRGLAIKRPVFKNTKTLKLPDNISVHLLGRRPDIVASIWRVNASCEGVANLKAQFYPDVNIAGIAGFLGFGLDRLFSRKSSDYQVGPFVTLPIFDAGSLRSQLREQYAYYEEAVANYHDTLNKALSDVSEQLTSIQSTDKQLQVQQRALDMANRAYTLAGQQFQYGLASQLVALNAQTQVLTEEQNQLALSYNRRNLQIALIKALGGGFSSPLCIVHKKPKGCCLTGP